MTSFARVPFHLARDEVWVVRPFELMRIYFADTRLVPAYSFSSPPTLSSSATPGLWVVP